MSSMLPIDDAPCKDRSKTISGRDVFRKRSSSRRRSRSRLNRCRSRSPLNRCRSRKRSRTGSRSSLKRCRSRSRSARRRKRSRSASKKRQSSGRRDVARTFRSKSASRERNHTRWQKRSRSYSRRSRHNREKSLNESSSIESHLASVRAKYDGVATGCSQSNETLIRKFILENGLPPIAHELLAEQSQTIQTVVVNEGPLGTSGTSDKLKALLSRIQNLKKPNIESQVVSETSMAEIAEYEALAALLPHEKLAREEALAALSPNMREQVLRGVAGRALDTAIRGSDVFVLFAAIADAKRRGVHPSIIQRGERRLRELKERMQEQEQAKVHDLRLVSTPPLHIQPEATRREPGATSPTESPFERTSSTAKVEHSTTVEVLTSPDFGPKAPGGQPSQEKVKRLRPVPKSHLQSAGPPLVSNPLLSEPSTESENQPVRRPLPPVQKAGARVPESSANESRSSGRPLPPVKKAGAMPPPAQRAELKVLPPATRRSPVEGVSVYQEDQDHERYEDEAEEHVMMKMKWRLDKEKDEEHYGVVSAARAGTLQRDLALPKTPSSKHMPVVHVQSEATHSVISRPPVPSRKRDLAKPSTSDSHLHDDSTEIPAGAPSFSGTQACPTPSSKYSAKSLDGPCVPIDMPPSSLDSASMTVPGGKQGWAERAFQVFEQVGFVVVTGVLKAFQREAVRQECKRMWEHAGCPVGHGSLRAEAIGLDLLSNEGFARHLLCSAGALLRPLLDLIFQSTGSSAHRYACVGSGGSFVTAGVDSYERLCADIAVDDSINIMLPPPLVSVDYCLQALEDNMGAPRIVPGTQLSAPVMEPEHGEWRRSRLAPVPAGSALLRDARLHRGGTPNRGSEVMFLPCVEYASEDLLYSPELMLPLPEVAGTSSEACDASTRYRYACVLPPERVLPRQIYTKLPEKVRVLCAELLLEE